MNQKSYLGFPTAKRSIDLLLSFVALIMLLPLLLIIAVWIMLDSPGPPLYLSRRMGKNGRPFTLYKFRTMYRQSQPVRAANGSYLVLDDDPRVTRVGRILRLGFDELPQLLNVLFGQMSLIGPRADPPEAYPLYDDTDRKRLSTKPGISGLAQVNGRTRIALSQRRAYDLSYIKCQSPLLDTCIFFLTLFELLPFLAWWGDRAQHYLNQTTHRIVSNTT